jgi:3',5'-nucleoside bisphosphate phosphatase
MGSKKILILIYLLITISMVSAQSRKIINIPNIPGYQTLKCDFHMHTVFSDGTVWPTVRVEEAWRDGLDAISITDHIEYRPHSKDIISGHNRSFEIAEPMAKQLNIILIRGAEITRNMPPGHLNALFIRNATLLARENVNDALREAREQGAFIIWNHPGWKEQQPNLTVWWNEHTQLLRNGMLHGIEVYNGNEYYPEAIDWANEKKLTMFSNSDVHGTIGMTYDLDKHHRPMTLVFARSRTEGGIREALFGRRTVVYFENTLMGNSTLLEPLFFASLNIPTTPLRIQNGTSNVIFITNNSDIDYEIELIQPGVGFDITKKTVLKARQVTPLEISGNSNEVAKVGALNAYYQINNMWVSSEENLIITFSFRNL